MTDTVAAALIEAHGRLGRGQVRLVLDGSAQALRLGSGQADSASMLQEHGAGCAQGVQGRHQPAR